MNYGINKSTALVLLDIEKAFDTVWRRTNHKLNELKVPLYIIKIIQNYLHKRTFSVITNGEASGKQKIVAVVPLPQGSILGPALFLYFINDIPKNPQTEISLFADDTAIFASSWKKKQAQKRVQEHINQIIEHFDKWKIKINTNKTELVFFSKKTKQENIPSFKTEEKTTTPKESAKYLGVHLDSKLTFKKHVKEVCNKAQTVKNQLYWLLCKKSKLNSKNKVLLYKTVIRTVIYATPVWSSTAKTNIRKIEVIQSKMLRMTTASEPGTRNSSNRHKTHLQTMAEEILKLTRKFYEEQTRNLQITKHLGTHTKETLPFTLKHKLPHHLIMQ